LATVISPSFRTLGGRVEGSMIIPRMCFRIVRRSMFYLVSEGLLEFKWIAEYEPLFH
jgi:hypothetical protein